MERLLNDPLFITMIQLGILVVLLVFSASFSATETALFCLNRVQRRQLSQEKSRRAQLISRALRRPRELLSTILFGNTLVNVSTSAVAALLFVRLTPDNSLTMAVVVDTLLVVLLGEVIPKTIAVGQARSLALTAIVPLHVFYKIFHPAVVLFDKLAASILQALRVPEEKKDGLSPSELEVLFDEAGRQDTITSVERRIARNIMRFSETTVEEIMTPRVDLAAASLDASREELEKVLTEARHTRIPLYEGNLDHIVGFVSTKEFFLNPDRPIKDLLKPVAVFPEGAKTHRVFRHMQDNRINMAVIVDEYGVSSGIVTMEDLVEEVVGEIYDEYEKEEEFIQALGPEEWFVLCRAPIEKVNKVCGLSLPEEDSVTLNGYLCDEFGEIPKRGRSLERQGVRFTIVESKRRRIVSCRIQRLPAFQEERTDDR